MSRHRSHGTFDGRLSRRALVVAITALGAAAVAWSLFKPTPTRGGPLMEVWKSPQCGCCGGWVTYMKARGYRVSVNEVDDMDEVKQRLGVPESLQSCHTARIDGYAIEGHVPEPAVAKLLQERPPLTGLALPGMPEGAPGMNGTPGRYVVLAFDRAGSRRFMTTGS